MNDRHWDGIAAHCQPENKVSLGFVEGLNNKIRTIQRRAYGFRDEEYLRLKILTCMLPKLGKSPTRKREEPFFLPRLSSQGTYILRRSLRLLFECLRHCTLPVDLPRQV